MPQPTQKHEKRGALLSNVITLVAVAFVLFLLTLVFIYFNNNRYLVELTQLADTSQTGSRKMQLYSEFAELARGRTRNTLQILETDDIFEQDTLNIELEGYAAKFAAIREELDGMYFSDQDKVLYLSAFEWVPKILPQQRRAVELMMHGEDATEARRLIYDIVLPGQQEIINIFSELTRREQQHIRENSENVNKSVLTINRYNNLLFAVVLAIFTALSVAVIYRMMREQKNLTSAYESLEQKVQERTVDLQVARDEALKANKAKSEFLSSMSHELRTPLNAIMGFSQVLEMQDLDESQKDSVQEIYKAGKHLLELINEVLDLAKIEAGHMEINMIDVDLPAVLSEVRSLAQPIADKYGIELRCAQHCGAVVKGDYTRLKQVFINLVSNAVKYNRPNGYVSVYCVIKDNRVRVCIEDSGIGIAPEQREGLFEPFNRLGAEGSDVEGTGIGMMITTQFVEMMGGELDFRSVVGEGSTFWVEMDLVVDETQEPVSVESTLDYIDAEKNTPTPGTVLYIEDNVASIKFMQQVLSDQKGYRMLTATAPSVGIDIARKHVPDLVLLDINLPEMNGYEVLEVLKSDPVTRDIPVIAVTANAMSGNVSYGEKSGFYAYLTKPVNLPQLLQVMEKAVNGKTFSADDR